MRYLFSCPPLMEITLKILESFLQASRSYLSKHIQVIVIVFLSFSYISICLFSVIRLDVVVGAFAKKLSGLI